MHHGKLSNKYKTNIKCMKIKMVQAPYYRFMYFSGEQHGFRKAENVQKALDGEFYFFCKVFGTEPADEGTEVSYYVVVVVFFFFFLILYYILILYFATVAASLKTFSRTFYIYVQCVCNYSNSLTFLAPSQPIWLRAIAIPHSVRPSVRLLTFEIQ